MLRLRHIWMTSVLTTLTLAMGLTACSDDEAVDDAYSVPADKVAVELTIRMKVSTLANEVDEEGSTWENYINMHGDDYRIYFFTSNNSTAANNTLIAELEPTSVYSTTSGTDYVTYTVRGELDGSFAENANFKVVVAANWGIYPTTTPGTTTMQDLCTAGTYSAFVETVKTDEETSITKAVMPSSTKHIPFYGVQDYTGVDWTLGHTTDLTNNGTSGITMVRAMAKVEVVVQDDGRTLSSVTLNRYNATGYCAPQYYSPNDTYGLHLVNGTNDSDEKTLAFVNTQERATADDGTVTQYETWTAYIPEYSNTGDNYSTITVTSDNEDESLEEAETTTTIYFGQYTNGTCDAYESGGTSSRFDIERNYCYRFTLYDMNSTISAQGAKGKGMKSHSQPAVIGTKIERNEQY